MIMAVLDTNVLVSALLSPSGSPARVLDHVLIGNIAMCFDSRIIAEYQDVLRRPKFGFDRKAARQVIDYIVRTGVSIVPEPLSGVFEDEDDKKFYEVAQSAGAYLVTGNIKHFPREPVVVSPQEFLSILESSR
jgi:putative PIN family toxin of toxin-antitoxin system